MAERIVHSFEAGRRGKPDELDTSIANVIGAHFLSLHPDARFDVRVSGTLRDHTPLVRVSGEVSRRVLAETDPDVLTSLIRRRYGAVHRSDMAEGSIHADFNFKPQADALASNSCAGDSGNPIAVAYRDGPRYLPWERFLAVNLRDLLDEIYQAEGAVPQYLRQRAGFDALKGLRADGKVGVEAQYTGARLDRLTKVTLAVEHEPYLHLAELEEKVHALVMAAIGHLSGTYSYQGSMPVITVNGAGAWNMGGWGTDEGSREAKPYRDGFASYGVQEDSFGGEDPTKPSATGTFLARHAAVQIVAHGLADFARVALSYDIGKNSVGINVFTNGTGVVSQDVLEQTIARSIPLRVQDGIARFNLRDPNVYMQVVQASDYFHDPNLPWNKVESSFE